MSDKKEMFNSAVSATLKGGIGAIPIAGSFLTEYIGLVQDRSANKIMNEWQEMIDVRLSKLEANREKLAEDEFFFSCVQMTTLAAMRSFQKEKREYFANALYNSQLIEISEEKKIVFITLIDKYPLVAIKLLQKISVQGEHIVEAMLEGKLSMFYPLEYASDKEFISSLTRMLINDQLVREIKPNKKGEVIMQEHHRANWERTEYDMTNLGREFLRFITDQENSE